MPPVHIFKALLPGSTAVTYFIDAPACFDREGLYQINGQDYPDNDIRFLFFSKAVVELMRRLEWAPDVVHANDWQTAMIIPMIKFLKKDDPFYQNIRTVYSIHNLAYMGMVPAKSFALSGLPEPLFHFTALEAWGQFCFAKGGLVYADRVGTVSEGYAQEIQTEEYGCGLEGVLLNRPDGVFGIVNGIDNDVWNPDTDKNIPFPYSAAQLKGKSENKKALQKVNHLPVDAGVPVVGIVSRLADQKGFDILDPAMADILDLGVQFILLGTGDLKYHKDFEKLAKRRPRQVAVNLGFDAMLAELIYAGSDMFLMPSRYEPCGLGQLISYRFGIIPVVRKTGGLAETVVDLTENPGHGTGFVFEKYDSAHLVDALSRAVALYRKPRKWKALQQYVMGLDYSWAASARKYLDLYRQLVPEPVPA